jgi:hypothetical protein
MKINTILIVCTLFFAGCKNDGYKYWDISTFNIVDSALEDNEALKLLYTSQGPGNNNDLEYYIHIIAVSQKTGDTVNILTTVNNGFSKGDEDKVFNYFDQNNLGSKLIEMDSEKLKNMDDVNEASKKAPKKIMKVVRDPKLDNIAQNKYPTVIGSIGTSSN